MVLVEECEWKQREKEINADIGQIFGYIEDKKKATAANVQTEKDEHEQNEEVV